MGRGTLVEVRDGSGDLKEVRDGSGDPWVDSGRVGGTSGRLGTVQGPSKRSEMGRGTLGVVQDG